MESYVSSESNARKRRSINTCLKSLNEMIDSLQETETAQPYTEIYYYGPVKNIANATFKYPRKLAQEIPVFGMVNGSYKLVGYTGGSSLNVDEDIFENYTRDVIDYDIITEITEEEYKAGTDIHTVTVDSYLDQLVITTTIIVQYYYKEKKVEGEIVYNYYCHSIKTRNLNFSQCTATIEMRF